MCFLVFGSRAVRARTKARMRATPRGPEERRIDRLYRPMSLENEGPLIHLCSPVMCLYCVSHARLSTFARLSCCTL
eukprot:8026808-Pyramimonas_sp.AAC.1